MNKKLAFQIDDLDLEVEVTCSVTPFYRGAGYGSHYGPTPDEHPEVEDLYVGIIVNGTSIDVTNKLPKKVIAQIKGRCLEMAAEEVDQS